METQAPALAPSSSRPTVVAPSRTGLHHFIGVTRVLAWTDFKQRYAGSALGYLWSVSKPLMLFGILYVVFTHILRFGAGVPHYPVMLLFAIVLWSYFTEVTAQSVTCLVARADLLRKIALPRIALPASIAATSVLIMFFNLCAVGLFVILNGVEPRMSWLWLIPLFAELLVLTFGVSLLLCVWYVGLRDIGQVWELVLQMLFYSTPIIYPITLAVPWLQKILLMSPLAQIVQQSREALVGTSVQSGSYVEIMDGPLLYVPYVIGFAIVALGIWQFRKISPLVAERV